MKWTTVKTCSFERSPFVPPDPPRPPPDSKIEAAMGLKVALLGDVPGQGGGDSEPHHSAPSLASTSQPLQVSVSDSDKEDLCCTVPDKE